MDAFWQIRPVIETDALPYCSYFSTLCGIELKKIREY